MIRVIHRDDMPLTSRLLDELSRAKESLGLRDVDIEVWRQAYEADPATPVIPAELHGEKENYEIESEGELVGIATATRDEDDDFKEAWEIDTLIFEKHRRRGFASEAKKALFVIHPERTWLGTVKKANSRYESIVAGLHLLGFENMSSSDTSATFRRAPTGRAGK